MTTQKFKVGDKVKVVRKYAFKDPMITVWNEDDEIRVSFKSESWWFPTQSLELVTDEETQKEPEKMKQQYMVLVWGAEEDGEVNCCIPVYDMSARKTFIGTKKEAKDFRDYMRSIHPEATYKIAKYPFIIEGHDIPKTDEVIEQPKKLVKKWRWVFENYDGLQVSQGHLSAADAYKTFKVIQKIYSTMIEVEEN